MKNKSVKLFWITVWYIVTFILGVIMCWLVLAVEYKDLPLVDLRVSKVKITYSDSVLILLTTLGIIIAIVTIVVGLLAIVSLKRIKTIARNTARKQAKKELKIVNSKVPELVKKQVLILSGGIFEILESINQLNPDAKTDIDKFMKEFYEDNTYEDTDEE